MTTNTSFLHQIRIQYNHSTELKVKQYLNTSYKITKLENRKIFLIKCRDKDISPKCTNFSMNHLQIKNNKKLGIILEDFHKKILNLSIKETFSELQILKRRHNITFKEIKQEISQHDFDLFIHSHKSKQERIFKSIKEKNIKKLQALIKEKHEKEKFEILKLYNPNFLQNISDKIIPENIKIILSLGPNFGLKYERKNLPIIDTISSIEAGIQQQMKLE